MAGTWWKTLWRRENPNLPVPLENPYEEEEGIEEWWVGKRADEEARRQHRNRLRGSIVSIPGADQVVPDAREFERSHAPSWTYGRYDRGYRNVPSASMGGGPSDLAESKAAAVPRKGFLGRGLNTKAFWEAMAEQEPYVDQTTAPPGGFVGESRVQGDVGSGVIAPLGVTGGKESLAAYLKRIKKEGGLIA